MFEYMIATFIIILVIILFKITRGPVAQVLPSCFGERYEPINNAERECHTCRFHDSCAIYAGDRGNFK